MWRMQVFGIEFYRIFYFFFIYCFFGWIWESCYVSVKTRHPVNRGFLNGPVIPIYGTAATAIFLTFYNPAMIGLVEHTGLREYVTIFTVGMLVASLLEFVTSYVMEKLFHAKWWDYSDIPLNLQGRVCLPVSIFWGALSVVLVKVLHPLVGGWIDRIPRMAGEVAGYVISVLFLADLVLTVVTTVQLDKKITSLHKLREEIYELAMGRKRHELTEELKERWSRLRGAELLARLDSSEAKAKEMISRYKNMTMDALQRMTYRRLFRAFPNMKVKGREEAFADVKERLQSVRQKWEQRKKTEE